MYCMVLYKVLACLSVWDDKLGYIRDPFSDSHSIEIYAVPVYVYIYFWAERQAEAVKSKSLRSGRFFTGLRMCDP